VRSETWQVASKDLLEGRKREEQVRELRNMAHCKQKCTNRRGGKGRSPFMTLEIWHIIEGSLTGRQEEGKAYW